MARFDFVNGIPVPAKDNRTKEIPVTGYVLPPYWLNHKQKQAKSNAEGMQAVDEVLAEANANDMTVAQLVPAHYAPLKFWFDDEGEASAYTFAVDPIISISGSNNVIKRDMLKHSAASAYKGSIKELWNQSDYEVTIVGVLIAENATDLQNQILRLKRYCESRSTVHVVSDSLTPFGIDHIVIEGFDFPHTAGLQNQQFAIKAASDDNIEILTNASANDLSALL